MSKPESLSHTERNELTDVAVGYDVATKALRIIDAQAAELATLRALLQRCRGWLYADTLHQLRIDVDEALK